MNQRDKFDIAIIGAGISGLTSAALFSRLGYSVCVLEMDARPGGYIAGFRRLDYRFDSAIHWLNQCGPKGLVTQAFEFIGEDFPKCKQQQLIRRYKIGDQEYLVTHQVDDFMNDLIRDFPHEEKGIRRFFRDAKRLGNSFDNFRIVNRNFMTESWWKMPFRGIGMLRFALPFIPHIRFSGPDGVKKGLQRYFKDPKLLEIWAAEPDLLSCLIPIGWAHVGDFQLPPVGGSQVFAEWLMHVTESYGNEIRFHARVSKLEVSDNKVSSITYKTKLSEEQIKADYVVSAGDLETLYTQLLPEGVISKETIATLQNAEMYASAFTVSLALDCSGEALGFGEEIIYIADAKLSREQLGNGDPHTSGIHVLSGSVRDKSLAPENGGTLTLFIPGFEEQYNRWKIEENENGKVIRGQSYKELKQEIAQIVIERVQKALNIDLLSHIVYLDIATPITHLRYTGNKGGTMMGTRPGSKNYKSGVASYKTPLKNLFISGHWAELGGGIPIAVKAAMNSTLFILKQTNKAHFNLLARYMDGKLSASDIENSKLTLPYSNDWNRNHTPAEKKAERTTN